MDAFGLDGLDELVRALIADGRRVIGPRLRDNAIVLDDITGVADLPAGWGVDVAPGRYRVRRRDDEALFCHSAGPQSWKQFVHPARRKLWETTETGFEEPPPDNRELAFLGVRGCDLAALGVLGRVVGNRIRPFIVAVDCTEPGGLCFCASTGTGPGVRQGYDLALTERIDDTGHWFLAEAGTGAGERMLRMVTRRQARFDEVAAALRDVTAAADRMGRAMPELDLRELLRDSRQARRWNDVAERCLTCGNCTMVCPTCFCTTTEDVTDLTGEHAERWEHWASCFEVDFSYLHGGSVRTSAASRYRQWLTHKLGTWHDQFGESGCVGCGRCIAWCPVGIDITAEVAALAAERSGDDVDV
ncbi:4Fe-4S dicluster domain-containing protein [Kutzneria sp. CA-103260]|uniref:4Fe-4S dicluster domain-containing protein n=1 Tax=Kutzneria sp. CA-103260 TaxID=2802641 RepID=UPI001BA964A6|nr:4Fe-4S dicluster domain-containing protein [Kutzneria sp. CA-103260]QUQ64063.1 [NiFe] hydrogenase subunit beta [Kutzneria sp. CA-103260]